ncbi:MAG TPA: hypothetical protein VFQ47_04035 [Nitrososphaera sp.]|jgi:hypothetical protein|nr:hypothetical protein [Nitrososphaera sp.]
MKLLIISVLLLLCACQLVIAQEQTIVSSGIFEKGVLLTFELNGIEHKRGTDLTIKYRVQNRRKQNIYLIMDEVTPGDNPKKREMFISLFKFIHTYHSFEFPKLLKIKPNGKYEGKASLPLKFTKDQFAEGGLWLYLTIGYLDDQDISRINNPRMLPIGAQEFGERQKMLRAGPVKFDLFE